MSNHNHKLSIKSKLGAEFRRFSLSLNRTPIFGEFKTELEKLHGLKLPFLIYYIDPLHNDLLPINNEDNFALAISLPNVSCLKLHLQTKGESWKLDCGSGKKKNFFENITNNFLPSHSSTLDRKLQISLPEDFRQVSSIIDVDIVPETCRRVRLVKHGSGKPLGFYIRDCTSVRVTVKGLEKVPSIFISRLVPGGLAESTGLLAVNDEVLEVNGIEVLGKSLDQVTDMMVANSSNLIITIRPANQRIPFNYPKPQLTSHPQQTHTSSAPLPQETRHNHANHKQISSYHQDSIPHSKSENNLHHHSSSSFNNHPHDRNQTHKSITLHSNNGGSVSSNSKINQSTEQPQRILQASDHNVNLLPQAPFHQDSHSDSPLDRPARWTGSNNGRLLAFDEKIEDTEDQQQILQACNHNGNSSPDVSPSLQAFMDTLPNKKAPISYSLIDRLIAVRAPFAWDNEDSDEEDEIKVHNTTASHSKTSTSHSGGNASSTKNHSSNQKSTDNKDRSSNKQPFQGSKESH